MGLVKAILLVCATSVPRAECQPETALHVINGPDATTADLCGFQAQAFMATMAFAEDLGQGTYLKVRCSRERDTAVVGRSSFDTVREPGARGARPHPSATERTLHQPN